MIKYALVTVFALWTPFLLSAQCGWFWQNPQPQGDDFEAVKVFKGGKVYAIDYSGDFIKTNNNGKSWTNTQVGSVSRLSDFHFSNANKGWITGSNGKIFHTATNGNEWQTQNTPTSKNLYAVHFVDNNVGWACGQLGVMLKTSNGGDTWKKQNVNTNKALARVFFIDQQTGWAITTNGVVFHTIDGGNNWTQQANFQTYTGDIQFIDSNEGWIVGDDVFYTNDGGTNWNKQSYNGPGPLNKTEFKNSDTGWAVADGAIMHTTDGGQTWQNQINNIFGNPNQNFFALSFLNTEIGWVVGINGVIRKTNNGGKNWLTMDSGTHERLYATDFVNPDTGWVVGREGNILETHNGGEDWQNQFTKHNKTFHGLDYVNAQQGWAVGENGTIEHTPDGGQTWQTQDHTTSNWLRAVAFTDAQNGWAVGSSGTILYTNNGGQNWVQQNAPVNEILTNVDFANVDTGWISGWGGTILHTTDGGQNWNNQTPGVSTSLYDLHFIGTDTGWAVGRDGTVLHTSDGGKNWRSLQAGINSLLEVVHFIDSKRGWAAGTANFIYYTQDGGKNWQKQPSPTNNAFNGMFFTDAQNGWAVGSDGAIIKTGGSPNANFVANKNGLKVSFNNTASTDTAVKWDFGDGDTSQKANPTHTFDQGGKQTVCLTIQTRCGTDSICRSFDLCGNTEAGYQYSTEGLTVNFQDTSTGASQWRWQFGDSFYSSKQNPVYTFPTAGTYEVCQEVSNTCSSDSTCQTISVCQAPQSAFTYTLNGLTVDFRDLSSNASQWQWFFDDGDTSMVQNPQQVYDSSGTYEVCQVTKNQCSTDTFCDTINMGASSKAEQRAHVQGVKIFPQPVLDMAQLRYRLSEPLSVSITIRNSQGKQVKSYLWSGQRNGKQTHQMDLSDLANGPYFYHFKAGDFQQRGKLILIGQ